MITFGEGMVVVFILFCVGFYIFEKFFTSKQIGILPPQNSNLDASETNEYNKYLTPEDKAYRLWKSLLDRTSQDKINWKWDYSSSCPVDKRTYFAKVNGVEVEVTEFGNLYFDANHIASDSDIKEFMELHYEISRSVTRKEVAAMERDKERSIKKFLGRKNGR